VGTLLLTIGIIGATMLVMAVGVILSNRCLRGSCGGPPVTGKDGEDLHCDHCPNHPQDEKSAVS